MIPLPEQRVLLWSWRECWILLPWAIHLCDPSGPLLVWWLLITRKPSQQNPQPRKTDKACLFTNVGRTRVNSWHPLSNCNCVLIVCVLGSLWFLVLFRYHECLCIFPLYQGCKSNCMWSIKKKKAFNSGCTNVKDPKFAFNSVYIRSVLHQWVLP